MGCGQSRLDVDEAPSSLRPPCRQSRRLMRGRRARKDSMMSTTDLLPSQADDTSEAASSVASPRMFPAEVEKRVVAEEEKPRGEAKERGMGFEQGGRKGEKLAAVARGEQEEEGDFPGSPSFRFYVDDVLDKLKIEEKSQQMDDSFVSVTSSEGSESKPTNKVKGKRISLKKGPNAVYNLFSARGCYNPNNQHHVNSAVARIAPHPTDDKEP